MIPSRILAVLLSFAALSGGASPALAKDGATRYRFDPVHSQIVFFVSHLGYSHGIGRIKLADGHFRFNPDDWSDAEVDVAIDIASVDMGDAKWSDTVRGGQFLQVERYPQARFRSLSVEKTAANNGVIHGELSLRGVTHAVDLQVTFNKAGRDPYVFKDKAGFSARTTLKRGDFGLDRYQGVVGEEVELRIEVEGIKDKQPPPTIEKPGSQHVTEEH